MNGVMGHIHQRVQWGLVIAVFLCGIPTLASAMASVLYIPTLSAMHAGMTLYNGNPDDIFTRPPDIIINGANLSAATSTWTISELIPMQYEAVPGHCVYVLMRIDPSTGFLEGGVARKGVNYSLAHVNACHTDATTTSTVTFDMPLLGGKNTPSGTYQINEYEEPATKDIYTSDAYTTFLTAPFTDADLGDYLAGIARPLVSLGFAPSRNPITFTYVAGTPASAYCTPGSTPDCNDNVMFLPGVGGSRLYRPDYNGGTTQLWEPTGAADQLELDASGESIHNDIYTKDVLDEAYPPAGPKIYASFMSKMDSLKTSHAINDWEAIPYDWRLSLADILDYGNDVNGRLYYSDNSGVLSATSTPYVIQELRRLAASSKTGRVTIVAHSNGGLVAKAMMQQLGDAETARLIDRVIFVAVPQVGTPDALAALLHGDGQALPSGSFPLLLTPQTARAVEENAPVAYNLLPSFSYFSSVADPVITFDPTTMPDWAARYGKAIGLEGQLHTFLDDSYKKVDALTSSDMRAPALTNAALLANAETLHTTLDAWTPPAGVQVIQIAGWGIPTTVKGLDYASTTEAGLTMTASTTIDGDGTVVVPSALWMSTSTPGVSDYWADLKKYDNDHWLITVGGVSGLLALDHKNILEVPDIYNFISDTITNSVQTISNYSYFSTQPPSSTAHRLRYELHSPLTLDLYDNQGRHTGISTTTNQIEEQIPGTYYRELAGVKYLFTDTNIPTHIVMQGYATSTFTFKVQELQDDTPITSTTFQDIPTTPTTKVTIGTDSGIAGLSPMNIDKNGDGVVDLKVAPRIGGTAFLDTIPPEASIGFSTSTRNITITGTDDQSTTTIATTATTTTIFDATGNSLKFNISKQSSQTNAATLIIPSFSYSTGSSTNATTTLRYFWATDKSGKYTLFISAIKTPTERIVSIYTSLLNKTYVVATTPSDDTADLSLQSVLLLLRQKLKTFSGLEIPYVFTRQGTMVVGY